MNNFIKIKNINKKYEKNKTIKVLNDISFNFESGKIYSIVGPSGSGKSTLLNLLSLIDTPTSGTIEINNNKINFENRIENDDIRAKNIGIIYQDKNLLPDFSAIENVYLPNLLLSNDKSASINLAKKIIKNLGLSSRLYHFPKELSGGQRQRVAVARALFQGGDVLLADCRFPNLLRTDCHRLIAWRACDPTIPRRSRRPLPCTFTVPDSRSRSVSFTAANSATRTPEE